MLYKKRTAHIELFVPVHFLRICISVPYRVVFVFMNIAQKHRRTKLWLIKMDFTLC